MCLGGRVLAAPMIAAGQLVQVHGHALPVAQAYHAVTLERNLARDGVRALWDWLTAAA